MSTRAKKKQESRDRILEVASRKLRQEGLTGSAIAPVMQEAGLTHGAFYSHFADKDELAQQAFNFALDKGQPRWFEDAKNIGESWPERLKRLAASYLRPSHRDDRANGCAIASLVSQVPAATDSFRLAFRARVETTLQAICGNEGDVDDEQFDAAVAFLALCVGGINLARAVDDPEFSERILAACRHGIEELTD